MIRAPFLLLAMNLLQGLLPPAAGMAIPTPSQLRYQRQEIVALIHFSESLISFLFSLRFCTMTFVCRFPVRHGDLRVREGDGLLRLPRVLEYFVAAGLACMRTNRWTRQ